jgi:hypothetical protein
MKGICFLHMPFIHSLILSISVRLIPEAVSMTLRLFHDFIPNFAVELL